MNSLGKVKNSQVQHLERLDFEAGLAKVHLETMVGKEAVRSAQTLKKTEAYQNRLRKNFMIADAPADKLAVKLAMDKEVKAHYEIALKQGIDALDSPCEEIVSFIKSAEDRPEFLRPDMIELGAQVFRKNLNILTFMFYGLPSMLSQFTSIGIAASAMFSGRPNEQPVSLAEHDIAGQLGPSIMLRFMETFKWFGMISNAGCSERFSESFSENCRVRIVHGYVRQAINNHLFDWNYEPAIGWDIHKLGVPLSASEGLVVVTTVAASIDAAKRDGKLKVTDHEMEAVYQWANYVAFMQGVPQELLHATAQETRTHFAAYLLSVNKECNVEYARKFVEALVGSDAEKILFPSSAFKQKLTAGLVESLLYDFFGKEFCNHYEFAIPEKKYLALFKSIKRSNKGINYLSYIVPGIKGMLDRNGEFLWGEGFEKMEKFVMDSHNLDAVVSGTENAHVSSAIS